MKAYNLIEEIVKKHLDEILARRFDICTCNVCRQGMIAHALSRLPPKYVTSEASAMQMLIEQIKVEQRSQILREIVEAIKVVSATPHTENFQDMEKAYQMLIKQIMLDRGLDFSRYRDRILKRRIALRMRSTAAKSYAEYLQVLIHNPQEYEKLFDVLTINVSSFFRDGKVWEAIKGTIVPDIIEKKKKQFDRKKTIRIWSAGCSHGEEPYTIAILLYELLEKELSDFSVEIIATDIDKNCLKQAQAGIYASESLKTISSAYLKRFFVPVKDKYQVVFGLKELIQFKEADLIHEPAVNAVDMVICRNVFIYFDRSLQEHLIMKFHGALLEDGYFVMGNSESLLGEAKEVFKTIDSESRIYQKIKMVY